MQREHMTPVIVDPRDATRDFNVPTRYVEALSREGLLVWDATNQAWTTRDTTAAIVIKARIGR